MTHDEIMRRVIALSIDNVREGGGPFAAIVAREGEIVSEGVNTVADDNDPTAHAELNAIRAAASKLQRFHLGDCVLYTSCEPCPMCLGAVYWAAIPVLYFGNSREDAARSRFNDEHIYHEIEKPKGSRKVKFIRMLGEEALEAFKLWDQKPDKILY